MVRRNAPTRRALFYWFGAPISVLVLAACSGFMSSDPVVSNWFAPPDCPSHEDGTLAIPMECCPCPWPDMCPNGWPPVPDYCRTGCEPGQPHECCMCPTEAWCTKEAGQTYKLPDWCKDKPWLDGGTDGNSAVCPIGTCAPKVPEGWLGPATLYAGYEPDQEKCPEGTTTWDGTAEPAPPGCSECICSTPQSTCGLSSHLTISSRGCDDFDNGVKWNFDPPSDWDGSCNGDKALLAGKLCGSEGLCAKSITISPPKLEQIDTTCTPSTKKQDLPTPKLFEDNPLPVSGRVCIDKPPTNVPTCGVDDQDLCVSLPGPGPACIARDGDEVCPIGWPVRSIFYREVKDNRTCSECSCGPVEGASCTTNSRVFTDGTCTSEYGNWTIKDKDPTECNNLIDGVGMAAKTGAIVDHQLGSCKPSGGELEGEVELNGAFTVCCLASDT